MPDVSSKTAPSYESYSSVPSLLTIRPPFTRLTVPPINSGVVPTSIANPLLATIPISAILTLKLREYGYPVDYRSPWDTPHAGDYDLDELFA